MKWFTILKLVLAPVLIWQGQRVKQKTPRLAEARGPRSGTVPGGSRTLRLLVLGDSAAAGVGVARQESCLSHKIPEALADRYTVAWTLEAQSGLTTKAMVEQLENRLENRPENRPEQTAPCSYDLAVTSLGVNDVKANVPAAEWLEDQKRLVALLREEFKVSQIIMTAVPPMEKFPALPWPLNRYLGERAGALNKQLARWLDTRKDCTYLEIELPFDPVLMAEDGFHPGPELHRIWAEQAAAVVRPDLGIPG